MRKIDQTEKKVPAHAGLRPVFATESDQKLTIELEDAATPELPIAPD